ncbi:hypothetical protein CLOM621_08001 [Clostridium sp. M62/1]|nr:hypothetical protein CLOM621_08001 [Clostridium sp. M62/1]
MDKLSQRNLIFLLVPTELLCAQFMKICLIAHKYFLYAKK